MMLRRKARRGAVLIESAFVYPVVFLVVPDYPEAFRGLPGLLCVIAAYLCHRAVIN